MNPIHEKLRQAITVSNQINALSQGEDWPQIGVLDKERMKLLEECVAAEAFDLDDETTKQLVLEIDELNNRAVSSCVHAKEAMIQEGQKIRKGKQAISAYQKQNL